MTAGARVRFVNNGELAHTVAARDGSWTTGALQPATWEVVTSTSPARSGTTARNIRGRLAKSLWSPEAEQGRQSNRQHERTVAMTRRRLPVGIQTFREVRKTGCYYVDKTAYLRRLVGEGKHYFLSRPRRFGKSLLLDTIKELFEGNQPLFEGLHIHDHWDWSVRHPVLRLDFGAGSYQEPGGFTRT